MKTVLVTGGAGFIGSNFVQLLFTEHPEYHIIVLDALTYAGRMESGPPGARESGRFEFWHGDVRDAELVDELVARSDAVVHLAAESHVTRSIQNDRIFFETDVIGTQTVAHAVAKHSGRVERMIHVSTSEVYGTALSAAMPEDHPLNPMSPYAAAKCGADRLIHAYWATYQLPAIIVRPFNNYGPSQHLEKVIPRFITSCIMGEPITIHGDGSAARDWVFVADHCAALAALLTADLDAVAGRVLNIGSGRARNILEVATAVRDAFPGARELPFEFVGERPGQVTRHTCDPSTAERVLGWTARTPFEAGLERTIRWYVDNEEWWRQMVWMRHTPIRTAEGSCELH